MYEACDSWKLKRKCRWPAEEEPISALLKKGDLPVQRRQSRSYSRRYSHGIPAKMEDTYCKKNSGRYSEEESWLGRYQHLPVADKVGKEAEVWGAWGRVGIVVCHNGSKESDHHWCRFGHYIKSLLAIWEFMMVISSVRTGGSVASSKEGK